MGASPGSPGSPGSRDGNRIGRQLVTRRGGRKGNALSDLGGGGGALGLDAEGGLDARLGAIGVARGRRAGLRVVGTGGGYG